MPTFEDINEVFFNEGLEDQYDHTVDALTEDLIWDLWPCKQSQASQDGFYYYMAGIYARQMLTEKGED